MASPLLQYTFTSNTTSTAVQADQSGYYSFAAIGTWNSGVLTAQIKPVGQSSYATIGSINYLGDKVDDMIWLNAGDWFQCVLAESTSGRSVVATLTWAM